MKIYPLCIRNVEEAAAFVKITNHFKFDLDIRLGSIAVDAKSILGVMTLCAQPSLELVVYEEADEDIKNSLGEFLVGEMIA